jgi:hypothetical protein
MTDGLETRIRTGSPTPQEEAVVLAAIERISVEERAQAEATRRPSLWVVAARVEATRLGANALRGPRAWRLSGLVGGEAATPTQTGQGDAK